MKFDLSLLFNILQLIGGIVLSIGYLPQIYKTIKTKSVKDFSLVYFAALWIGIGLMETYAVYNLIHGVAIMFFVTNTIAFSCESCMLFLILLFGKKDRELKRQIKKETVVR